MEQNYTLTRIRELLEQRNWSLYKLAQEADIPYSSLNSLFRKNNQPTITTLEKICTGFHISVSEFFYDNISAVSICDFSSEETAIISKIRTLNSHDKNLLMALLDAM
ncbi:MAG: helix-turn-helix transcriptional regulator [Bacillus sp. (in: Bacteria)]|nr:helix-turn-helix transcriptional regulator [Bacillus sp. (in: firmicutes)]MCM1425149.1 helix-turn-helix transcriptional regulator [Eubacterium sp.]